MGKASPHLVIDHQANLRMRYVVISRAFPVRHPKIPISPDRPHSDSALRETGPECWRWGSGGAKHFDGYEIGDGYSVDWKSATGHHGAPTSSWPFAQLEVKIFFDGRLRLFRGGGYSV